MVINGAVTSVTPVPEPGSCALLLVGLGLFPLIRRRQV
jgi:MYXO-CTERM domain-containing protein